MNDIGHGLGTFVKIGVIAALFILGFKWAAAKTGIAGLQTAANAI